MEKLHLPGLANINALHSASILFVDDNVVCFPVNAKSGSNFSNVTYYNNTIGRNKYERIICVVETEIGEFANPSCNEQRWHKADGRLYLMQQNGRDLHVREVIYDAVSAKMKTKAIGLTKIHVDIVDNILQRCFGDLLIEEGYRDMFYRPSRQGYLPLRSLFDIPPSYNTVFSLLLGKKYEVPEGRCFASFSHSNKLYLLSCTEGIKAAIYCSSLGACIKQEDIVVDDPATRHILNLNHEACDTHVIEDTVFLIREKDKQLFKLDLKSFQMTIVTSEAGITSEHLRFAFHEQFLYATSRSLRQAINRFDLTSLIDEEENENLRGTLTSVKETSNVECPVCLEPFQDPKVLTKCGHSICGGCEKQITVDNILLRTQTLTCPQCRVSTVIGLNESLPTNWALKSGASASSSSCTSLQSLQSADSLRCEFCEETLTENKTFNCEFCAEKGAKLEVFVCGTCVVTGHGDHFASVKPVKFADNAYRKLKIGHISRDPVKPEGEKTALRAEISQKADVELDAFFGELTRDYGKVNRQVTSLMAMTSISQKAMDKAAEQLVKDETAIDTKIQQLEDWKKEVSECFSKLNKKTPK